MVSINKAAWVARVNAAAGKSAAWVVDLVAQARASRFVRKFSWRKAFRFLALSLFLAAIGLLVGVMTVILPPMASIGTVAVALLLLIWTAPELRHVPTKMLRKIFFVVVFIGTCVPNYYAVQIPGLPWFSIRRIVVLCLIILFAVAISGSKNLRDEVMVALRADRKLFTCVAGYYLMCVLSLFTSANPSESISMFSDYTLNGFVPLITGIIVIRSFTDVKLVFKLICSVSLFVAALGVADFIWQHNYAVDILPKALVNAMVEANPSLNFVFNGSPIRDGQYRASSIFMVPLSFGEYAAIVGPLGGYFIAHGEKIGARVFGALIILGCLGSLFASGARGGSMAFLIAMSVFLVLWVIRSSRANPHGMHGALGGASAFMGLMALLGLVLSVQSLRKKVLGGSETASSDTSRFDQANMAWPHILANPLTGHGLGNAGVVIGYTSPDGGVTVDSSILTLVVETGVPGIVLFFGMLLTMAWTTGRIYINGKDRDSAVGAAFACSGIAYSVYRLVLSQRENQSLMLILIGCAFAFIRIIANQSRAKAKQTAPSPGLAGKARYDHAARQLKPAMTPERPV